MQPAFNYEALTPTAFLARAAVVFPDRVGVVDGERRFTYAEFHDRCLRMAGALRELGVAPGERIAVLAPNTHLLLAAHYAVPFAGAVLVALNTRITATDIAYILRHAGAKLLIHDASFAQTAHEACAQARSGVRALCAGGADDELEAMIAAASPFRHPIGDERSLLAINYTSGTTGRPKGVMYHHRGAYLQALAMALHTGITSDSVYLWTLPMFHCNGWCFPWAVTAMGGMHLCLRKVDAPAIWRHLRESERMALLGLDVMHLYGLTETYGPAGICEWRSEWSGLRIEQQARLKARQGVANAIGETIRVVDADGRDVPADAETMGEIAIRGNNVMLGYYQDEAATRKACPDGWFRTGDLGVLHPDGYVELRDRAKDIIISGGENISSVEVEQALTQHPAVLEVAVVAAPDEKWGEVPVAFVALKEGTAASGDELIGHARTRLARFKVPKRVVFGALPKTSTGKVQKNALRERLRAGHETTGGALPD